MRKILLLFIFCWTGVAKAQNVKTICNQINTLNTAILNSTMKRTDAALSFKKLIGELKAVSPIATSHTTWCFPLQGYGSNAIGGVRGNGYFDKGYNFLDGNKHSAHPAHDIFIRDKNQDGLDDRTLEPVNVLAVDDGIVIACINEWDNASALRGGRFIWVYHPQFNQISYYAHNRAIFVSLGDVVTQGQKIAEVGRTGLNAYKKRSPTHLHFSAFKLVNGLPLPYNPYAELTKATKK